MASPITVNVDLPTDNTDVLSGSLLDPVPGRGVLVVYVASSVRDGILTVTGPGVVGSYRIPPILRANGIPDVNSDLPVMVPTIGGKVIVGYDEVGAGDAFASIMWVPR